MTWLSLYTAHIRLAIPSELEIRRGCGGIDMLAMRAETGQNRHGTHDPDSEPAGFSRIWILQVAVSSQRPVTRGGLSMAFRTSRSSRVAVWVGMLPLLQELLCLLQQCLNAWVVHMCVSASVPSFPHTHTVLSCRKVRRGEKEKAVAHPLQSGIGDIPILLEERADVERLAAPKVPVHRPV